jgi:hypothetical protein
VVARLAFDYYSSMRILRVLLASIVSIGLVSAVAVTPASAADKPITVRVYHEAVNPIAVSGTGIGAVRTFFIPMAVNGVAADGQYLAGTLTTLDTAMTGGQELRSSNLTYVFGAEKDQMIVGGVSLYPAAGATIAAGQTTIRPVIGGSGKYSGARGQVVSTNMGANGWTHVFKVWLGK